MMDKRRKQQRYLIDLPMVLSSGGKVLDAQAVVHDLTPQGFGFETRHRLKQGQRIHFDVALMGDERAAGEAEVRWLRAGDWGTWAGARITKIDRKDARRIRRTVLPGGYDWTGLWDRALTAAFIVALVLLVQDLVRHHWDVVRVASRLVPDAIALSLMGFSAVYFLRRRR